METGKLHRDWKVAFGNSEVVVGNWKVVFGNWKVGFENQEFGSETGIRKLEQWYSEKKPTNTVHKSYQAGKNHITPWHSGDLEKSHQVVESEIRDHSTACSSIIRHVPKSGRSIVHSREDDRFFVEKVRICRES